MVRGRGRTGGGGRECHDGDAAAPDEDTDAGGAHRHLKPRNRGWSPEDDGRDVLGRCGQTRGRPPFGRGERARLLGCQGRRRQRRRCGGGLQQFRRHRLLGPQRACLHALRRAPSRARGEEELHGVPKGLRRQELAHRPHGRGPDRSGHRVCQGRQPGAACHERLLRAELREELRRRGGEQGLPLLAQEPGPVQRGHERQRALGCAVLQPERVPASGHCGSAAQLHGHAHEGR
mmetsp:Transcript_51800/g.150442  ORF Transcript_51800/g.150442 Transcript_51800/m.150442 type:complete len:233 (+) Transcript_51800:225-923(+)